LAFSPAAAILLTLSMKNSLGINGLKNFLKTVLKHRLDA